ncbi:filamentous hemagglutinin N-terminal domain-containing protein [Massilia sp. TW-1]|uniref:Filamentous hemagglutinin N-terminal domain-containing protein n=1 Tax=Telluria antibiotica TaxID=2717319 RepID=A0ABX0P4V8_9BURK|nr:filamentous hemagglutinin N-terminal domain-containing protein [Telluria antibiotica]NIA52246.1 filamentous hemagglutinin N-terminal domain-containing protein [Telluria antibiotica]
MRKKTILRSSRVRRDMAWPMMVAASLPLAAPLPTYAQALPTGATVTAGKVTINTPNANALVVRQDSQRGVVNWSSFNIGQGNTVSFVQPDAGAATLNVVKGATPTDIAGTLKANGSVFLINQNGIAISATGVVDTRAGFVASTLGMSEDDFMAGRNVFSGKGGAVVNRGRIVTGPGGNVALLGSSAGNEGVISAPLGKVALGAAQAATLDLSGDGYLQVLLPADAKSADGQALVSNQGVIEADGGVVMLKASTVSDALREAVNMPGTIRARTVSGHDGAIVLEGGDGGAVRVSGTLDTSAAQGVAGRIDVGGAQVALAGARLDATGAERGGLVRVGGTFQGGKAQPPASEDAQRYVGRFGTAAAPANASTTTVDAASRIDVSAHGAAGEGGTVVVWSDKATTMQGSIAAGGAKAAGAVEVSSASTVQSVALNRIALGKGGKLLLDPQDIQIDDVPGGAAGDIGYGDNPGGVSHLYSADLVSLLGSGTSVSLKASQDIEWNTFSAVVTRPFNQAAGALSLAAGRSVTLNGVFGTADADWSIVANDTAAHGVVDSERGAGMAQINLGGANFINSNGKLTLTLSDGAGNTERDAGGIFLGSYSGNGLSAAIAPGATNGGLAPYITLTGDVTVAGNITLTGNLSVSAASATLSGNRVNWTTEATDALRGEGAFKFVENGTITRFGQLNGGQATRLALGDGINAGTSRVYGDADPDAASLGTPLLHVTSGTAPDAMGDILAAGSLAASGPGVTANAGSHTLTLGGTAGLAFNGGLSGGYFIDMTPVAIPLTVTRRTVTANVGAVQGTYGTAASVVTLSNVVNNDTLSVLGTLNGGAGQVLNAVGAGYGFSDRTAAGTWPYAVTGLSGAAAGNYTLAPGSWTGTLAVAPKTVTYDTFHSPTLVYGDTGYESASLNGVLAGDTVAPVPAVMSGGVAVPAGRLKVGSYDYVVAGLSGADAANYRIAASGNLDTPFTVTPRVLDYAVAAAGSTYGSPAALGAVTFNNVLPGDAVTPGAVGIDVNGARLTGSTTATTPAGTYTQSITSVAGADATNYTLAGSAPGAAMVVARKPVHWAGTSSTQEYGQDLPVPALTGVINGDDVAGVAQIVRQTVTGDPSPSGKPSVGQYELGLGRLGGTGAGNYILDLSGNQNAVVTVAPKVVTYATGSLNVTYGDGGAVPGLTLNGVLAGDVFDVRPYVRNLTAFGATAIDARAPAGTYSVEGVWIPHSGDNYVLSNTGNTNGTVTIAKRPVSWTVGSGTALYGNAPGNPVTLTGALPGDDVVPRVQALDGHGAGIALPGVGTYTAGVTGFGGAAGGNYVSVATGNVTGQLTIAPKPLSLVVKDSQSVYGTLGAPAVALDGLVGSDTLGIHAQVSLSKNGSAVALSDRTPAGTYTVQATAQVDSNPNYTLQNNTGTATLTVKPKVLTYTGPTGTYEYGAVVNGVDLHNTLNGVLSGDDVTLPIILQGSWTNTVAKRQVGDYPFPVSLILGLQGRDAGNYSVTSVGSSDGLITIVPKTINYKTWFLDSATRQYGDVKGQVAIQSDVMGLAFADDRVSLGAASLAGASYSTGGYLNAGTYATQVAGLSGPDAGNYRLATTGNEIALLTVVPRAVSPSWSLLSQGGIDMGSSQVNSVVYGSSGGAHPSMTGFTPLAGDKVSLSAQIQLPGGPAAALAGQQPVGSYFVTAALGGQDAANYYVRDTGVNGEVGRIDVTPRPVSVTYKDWQDTYGITPQPSALLNGVLPGQGVQAAGQLLDSAGNAVDAGFHTPAGSYTYQATGLTGSAAGNYTLVRDATSWLDSASGMTLTVGPSNTAKVQVDKARLAVSYTGPTDMVYGTNPTRPTVTGFVPGDVQDWSPWLTTTASPTPADVGKSFDPRWKNHVPAGTYDFSVQLSDALAKNYEVPAKLPGLTVARRAIGGAAAGASFVYTDLNGLYAWQALTGTLSGIVPGDDLTVKQVYVDGKGSQIQPNLYTDAGTYQVRLADLGGTAAANYVLDPALVKTASVVIKPMPLDLHLPATQTSTYGSSPVFAVAGTYPKDAVTYVISGAGLPGKALTEQEPSIGNGFNRTLVLDQLVDAGEYAYTISLGGAKPGNYVLTGATGGTWAVKPKTLTWTVSAGSGQYGYYKDCDGFSCTSLVPGVDIGKPVYNGVIPGDDVGGSVVLLDLKGAPMTVDAKTPVGKYFEVVSGLTGAQAKNYTLATSGNLPGTLTINPLYLRYSTASSVVIEGQGQIGDAGKATLQTIGGVPLPNGDTMPDAAVAIYVPAPADGYARLGTALEEGRYYYEAIGLTGQYAGNYRLLPVQNHGRYNIPVTLNDLGALDVYKDSRFGLPFVAAKDLPALPVVTPPDPSNFAETYQAGGAQFAEQPGGSGFKRTTGHENRPTPDYDRPVTGSGSVFETHVGPGGVSAAVGGAAGTDLASGTVDVNAQASGVATALASFGVSGVTVSATADGHVDITISSGPVEASVGAQAETGVQMKLGRTGVKIEADATAGAYASAGVHGGLGGGLDGNVNLTSGTFAYATTSYNYGVTNGVLTMTTGAHAGVGASTGVSGGFSGEAGAVQGGATVYSPGSVGGNFTVGAGYSNGVIEVSLDLGAQIGIGGLELKLNFGVDVGKVGQVFSDLARGGGPDIYERQRDADSHALSLANDPAARFAYLSGNADWNHDGDGSRDNAVFLQQYTDMLKATAKMVTDQQTWQKTFLNLLQTDPAKAVAFSRAKPDFTRQYWDVNMQAGRLGVRLRVEDGQLVYANLPR